MERLNASELKKLDFGVRGSKYVTLRNLSYKNIFIQKGFIFDGVTVKSPFTFIFNSKDLMNGIMASCFHDYMCQNKKDYKRKFATDTLVELWKKDGLSNFKAYIVKVCVNTYQIMKGGWKK